MSRFAQIRLLALCCISILVPTAIAQRPRVTTAAGTIEGILDSASGVAVFNGIPYGAAPVGDLRWRAPKPAAHWQGVRDGAHLAKNCMQGRPFGDIDPYAAGVSEDCLNLNVWTAGTSGAPKPVMVWIHGGGFFAGFGGEERHNGGPLAKKGVVVVTLNYRLGPLGFLAHPALALDDPHHSSGNYGLLDQIEALKWVKQNISRFGGDPSRVTIFGESAGGMSVGALIGSLLAKGLFHRAILESGVGLGGIIAPRDSAEAAGIRFAKAAGVDGVDASAARQLRALNADTLLAVAAKARTGTQPVIDGWVIPRLLDSTLASGKGNIVPVIVGSNADEGDPFFGAPARAFARLITAQGKKVYLYQYSRVGDDSVSRKQGAYHSSEITFVFGRPAPIQPSAGHTAYDATLADAMSDYWVAFATTGDPNGAPSAGRRPKWPVYEPKNDPWMELGPTIEAKTALKRALYDSLDAVARKRGEIRP
jgi:para-nitrobenzyl esterase